MRFNIEAHPLKFVKPAKTSRGDYTEKTSFLISLEDKNRKGIGEASPLTDLSIDVNLDFHAVTQHLIEKDLSVQDILGILESWSINSSNPMPTLRFALHCALTDLNSGGTGTWIDNDFTQGKKGLKINGLIWMNNSEIMYNEAIEKIESGFKCIKFKVGSLNFDDECRLIEKIRKLYNAFQLEIRLDANGAFSTDTAMEQLNELKKFEIHSIEQPVRPRYEELDRICKESPIAIALDEELIGIDPSTSTLSRSSGATLLRWAKPHYLIIKPTLLGGIDKADDWIALARKNNIGWWSTSALEGNIGLAAIAQWVSRYQPTLPQGLGTGALYKQNFEAKTYVVGETLWYKK